MAIVEFHVFVIEDCGTGSHQGLKRREHVLSFYFFFHHMISGLTSNHGHARFWIIRAQKYILQKKLSRYGKSAEWRNWRLGPRKREIILETSDTVNDPG
jgi:hypothetical protein